MNPEHRLEELEAKLTLAEDLLETLNLAVFRQQERIGQLEQQLTRLAGQLRALQPPDRADSAHEVPPHY